MFKFERVTLEHKELLLKISLYKILRENVRKIFLLFCYFFFIATDKNISYLPAHLKMLEFL